ncbi:MAG TPA: fasciclin domain-containing protein [Ohtaekwangia sp.]|uniref:fasciclin domain-containing protein n=1 Tax=Ohtaekwangia sp. TaxID=2066019 RepID=UPI002F92AF22
MRHTIIKCLVAASLSSVVLTACNDDFTLPATPSGSTITALATDDSNFDVLTAALVKTGLATSLDNNNSGQFTLFAPTDDAFVTYFKSALGKSDPYTEDSVIAYINTKSSASNAVITTAALSARLTYHIISSNISSASITGDQVFTTLNSSRLSLSKTGSDIVINAGAAKVTAVDKEASNGVIHTIDKVLAPVGTTSVLSYLGLSISYTSNPPVVSGGTASDADGTDYDLFAALLKKTGLVPTIQPNQSPLPDFTIFAPNDNAVKAFLGVATEGDGITLINGFSANDIAAFKDILSYHIVSGRVLSTDLTDGQQVSTLLTGKSFTASVAGSTITLIDNDANVADPVVVRPNVLTNAGVLHGIDNILYYE